jgi:hypothetical protein
MKTAIRPQKSSVNITSRLLEQAASELTMIFAFGNVLA